MIGRGRVSAGLQSLGRRARETAEDAAMLARLTRDLPRYLRSPLTADEARAVLTSNLAAREQRFLTVVEQAIFAQPRGPYLTLFRHAGCELGDVRNLVANDGVEGTLRILADRGVYLAFDELKGRRDVVRGSLRFSLQEHELDNPLTTPHFLLSTSGSAGRPTRVRYPLAYLREQAAGYAAALESRGLHRARIAFWWPVPHYHILMYAMIGLPTIAWWYPVHPLSTRVWLIAHHLWMLGRLMGIHVPLPARCDLTRPEPIVDWLTAQARSEGPLVLVVMASAATRIGIAAAEAGRDLRGITMQMSGEPVTGARRLHVEAAGASPFATYASAEHAGIANGCATPSAADDVHVMLDRYAVVTRARPALAGGPIIQATLLTALSPFSAKIALYAELGDHATLEERDCGCLLGALGLRTHLSAIRSFEKVTGEGVTFARSNLEQILEGVLPARFGGTSLDYQLAEEEAPNGVTRLVLRVRPSVGAVDEALLRAAMLDELGRGGPGDRYQAEVWRNAGTVEIRREAPLATRAGKVLPFQLLEPSERSGAPRAGEPS